MKVCIISQYHLETSVVLANHLSKDHAVDIYCLFNDGNKHTFLFDLNYVDDKDKGFVENLSFSKEEQKVLDYLNPSINISFFMYDSYGLKRLINYSIFKKLCDKIKKNKYDVVHIVGQDPVLILLHLYLHKLNRVHTLHESTTHDGTKEKMLTRVKLFHLKYSKTKLIFHSKNILQRFLDYTGCNPKKCFVVNFGVFETYRLYLDKPIEEEANTILFFGLISKYKGINYLADSIDIVKKVIPDIKLVIAGKGNIDDIRSKAGENISIINRTLSSSEISEFVARSKVVVCPYTSASQSGILMTVFALDKPVIASNVSGLDEVIHQTKAGILVEPENPQAIADAIIMLLTNTGIRKELTENAAMVHTLPSYNWDEIAKKTAGIYSSRDN